MNSLKLQCSNDSTCCSLTIEQNNADFEECTVLVLLVIGVHLELSKEGRLEIFVFFFLNYYYLF